MFKYNKSKLNNNVLKKIIQYQNYILKIYVSKMR